MHHGVLFASHLAQASRLLCTASGKAENRYVYCIEKQNRKKKKGFIHTRKQFLRHVNIYIDFHCRTAYRFPKVYTEECFLTQLHAQEAQQFTICNNLNPKLVPLFRLLVFLEDTSWLQGFLFSLMSSNICDSAGLDYRTTPLTCLYLFVELVSSPKI